MQEIYSGNEEYEKTGYLYEDFKMFHIRTKEEESYPYHYHDFYKLLILLQGNVTYSIEGKSYKLSPFDMVLVRKGAIHRAEVSGDEPYDRIVFYISGEYLERCKTADYDPAFCFVCAGKEGSEVLRFPVLQNTAFLSLIGKLEENGQNVTRYGASAYAELFFSELLLSVNRGCYEKTGSFDHTVLFNQKMIDLIRYIGEHLTEDMSIEELAERFYISKFHMMRQFKEETGFTIHQYISEKRIIYARSLMAAGMSATQACYESGFKDYSTFSRAYKRRMEKSPSEKE